MSFSTTPLLVSSSRSSTSTPDTSGRSQAPGEGEHDSLLDTSTVAQTASTLLLPGEVLETASRTPMAYPGSGDLLLDDKARMNPPPHITIAVHDGKGPSPVRTSLWIETKDGKHTTSHLTDSEITARLTAMDRAEAQRAINTPVLGRHVPPAWREQLFNEFSHTFSHFPERVIGRLAIYATVGFAAMGLPGVGAGLAIGAAMGLHALPREGTTETTYCENFKSWFGGVTTGAGAGVALALAPAMGPGAIIAAAPGVVIDLVANSIK